MKPFEGSYIQVILDIAESDPHCALAFVKGDIESARAELKNLYEVNMAVFDSDSRERNVMERVFQTIRQERLRQNMKWGNQDHPDLKWFAIFMEEVGEIAKALVEAKDGNGYPMKMEIIHAVAVGVQWLEKL